MSDLKAGELVDGRYRVVSLLGRGGMAAVYLVRHHKLGTFHAIKVLELDRPSMRNRLLKEGAVQSRLRHANLVAVSDAIEVHAHAALVMEYVHGPTLAALIERKRLDQDELDCLAAGLLDGVEAAHAASIVHRDLKPHNVLLSVEGDRVVPKITDFGLVKLLDDETRGQTQTGTVFGTPEYMAPEQINNAKSVDPRADVWSLGVMLYEMAAGERPFQGENLLSTLGAITTGKRKPLRDVAPKAPDRVIEAVEAALVSDREQRVQSVQELRALWFKGATLGLPAWDRAVLLAGLEPLPQANAESPIRTPSPDAPVATAPAQTTGYFEKTPDPVERRQTPVTFFKSPSVDSITIPTGETPAAAAPPADDLPKEFAAGPPAWAVAAVVLVLVAGTTIGVGLTASSGSTTTDAEAVAPPPRVEVPDAPTAAPAVAGASEPSPTPSSGSPEKVADRPRKPVGPVASATDGHRDAPAVTPSSLYSVSSSSTSSAASTAPAPIVVVVPNGSTAATATSPQDVAHAAVATPAIPPPPVTHATTTAATSTSTGTSTSTSPATVAPTDPSFVPPRVRVLGGTDMTVMLRDDFGNSIDPSEAKVGHYVVTAWLSEVKTEIGSLDLKSGSKFTIKCNYMAQKCSIVPG